jgi:photosystem II stability/assembly factor-like uncharacterized protein
MGAGAQDARIRWDATGGPIVGHLEEIVAQRGRLLLVGSGGGWLRTPDRGVTWEAPAMPRSRKFASNDRHLFADGIDGVGRSSDMGDSWTPCGSLPVNRPTGNEVTSIAADENQVYVSVFRLGLYIGFFRSEDQCVTWNQLEAPWRLDFPPTVRYVEGLHVIVHAVGGPFLSIDAGNIWAPLGDRVPDTLTFATNCNGAMLAGTGRGAFVSRDNGRSWTSIGFAGRRVPAIAAPRCDEVFAVVQDAGRWTHSVFRSPDGGATWTTATDGLSGHPIRNLSIGEEGNVYAVGDSGAFRWLREGHWQQIGPATTVVDLVATPWGDVLAAAAGGLYHAKAAAGPWRKLLLGHDANLSSQAPSGDANASLATVTSQGDVLVATQGGVLRSRDRGETWRLVGLKHTVHSFLSTRSGSILAATENGIFRSNDAGENWVERSMGLTDFRMYSLARASDGTVYAGTWEGAVFRSSDEGDRWRPLPSPRGLSRLHALVVLRNGQLLAGTDSGLSKWDPATQLWQPILLPSDRRTVAVRALAQDAHGAVFAGTEGRGIFASLDEGKTWHPANEGLTANEVFSLAVDAKGQVLAGTSAGVFRAQR